MAIQITITNEDAIAALADLSRLAAALKGDTGATVEVVTADAPKPRGRPPKAAPVDPVQPTPLEQAVEATKAPAVGPKPVEKQPDTPTPVGEAECRAGLQKLHSLYSAKQDGPSGIKAAQTICAEFGVKKVSDLTVEQHQKFVDRIDAAIKELVK